MTSKFYGGQPRSWGSQVKRVIPEIIRPVELYHVSAVGFYVGFPHEEKKIILDPLLYMVSDVGKMEGIFDGYLWYCIKENERKRDIRDVKRAKEWREREKDGFQKRIRSVQSPINFLGVMGDNEVYEGEI